MTRIKKGKNKGQYKYKKRLEKFRRRNSLRGVFGSTLMYMLISVVVGYLLTEYIVSLSVVDGLSMYPTYDDGEVVFLYRLADIERGDVVVARKEDGKKIIKRVVGMPGDTIEIVKDLVYINGKLFQEAYINFKEMPELHKVTSCTLQEGEYFLLGDNRGISLDSRENGPVKRENIIGVIIFGRGVEDYIYEGSS